MFQATYVVFLIISILYNKTVSCFDSLYAVRTNEYPKTSCQKFANIETAGRCLGTCGITMDRIVMICHDETTHTCMCCSDLTGSDITGLNWKSFVPLPCADGYATYNLKSNQICLKYIPVPVSYSTAQANCQAEGTDLIKIDSQEKYDIFNDYHVPIANNSIIHVWVQGEKVGGQWQFDDGTLMPGFCPIRMSNKPGEVHLRAEGSTSFKCTDFPNGGPFHYSCEYNRVLSFNN